MRHECLNEINAKHDEMYDKVCKIALEQLKIEGKDKCDEIENKESEFFKKPLEFALKIFDFSICDKCKQPFYAGYHECNAAGNFEREKYELTCNSCMPEPPNTCHIHGKQFLRYKCRFCCAVATFHCGGVRHFCEVRYVYLCVFVFFSVFFNNYFLLCKY